MSIVRAVMDEVTTSGRFLLTTKKLHRDIAIASRDVRDD